MKIYREDQKYHDAVALSTLCLLSALLIITIFTQAPSPWQVLIGIAVLSVAIYLVLNIRLRIRISPKKMTFKVLPFPWTRCSIPRDEVQGVEFVASENNDVADGWTLHYGAKLRVFGFGDRKGMLVHRNDGRDIFILSRKLFEQQHNVLDQLRSSGWSL